MSDRLWYFAYGSNLDPDRFRGRIRDWSERKRAILSDYRLRFSGEVTAEGGGGAIIEGALGEHVYGGVYRISRAQIDKLDEVELGQATNPEQRGERKQLRLECPDGRLDVEVYVVRRPKRYRAPSKSYLAHIVKGLRAFGYGEEIVEHVIAVAGNEPG